MSAPVKTTCPYCGVGCGVLAYPDGRVKGDPDHPANKGRLCSKGSALGETLDTEGRLLAPQIGGQPAGWDAALDLVAQQFREAVENYGPDSVAFYGSGQLLTEDYYVANKLMKGFIGSANMDTNSRLCMASSVAGHKRAFGTDTVPGIYEDLELADLVVLVGSNLAWCHPVLYQRIAAAKVSRPHMRVVVVDPRRTATCDLADQHLAIVPGTDVALFNTVLSHISRHGAVDVAFSSRVSGLKKALLAAFEEDPKVTGLSDVEMATFCEAFTKTEKVVTVYSQGVNQACDGTDKVNAILNCHLATGRIGRPGMGPFSITGQPNAMGGREVGGLSNMLACHLDLDVSKHKAVVETFWQAPNLAQTAGFKAVDLFEAMADGQIKALWIMSTNPAVSMPEADRVRLAIKKCPFVVVSDVVARTDTSVLADVLLPAAAWGEKEGTVTNSDRTISRQRAFLPAPGEARPDWQIICDVAKRMGWIEAFGFTSPVEIFREHATLSGIAAEFGRDFDISAARDISDHDYETWEPRRWPFKREGGDGRFFGNGQFFTPNGLGRAVSVRQKPLAPRDQAYPFILNTGRVRDHWHTMTRTGKSARLSGHMAEPFVEIHPNDAKDEGVAPADLVKLETTDGTAILRARVTDCIPQGNLFVPMHWTAQWSSDGRVGGAIHASVDPISGQPALKFSRARLMSFQPVWYGFALSTQVFDPSTDYWALAKCKSGYSAELAGLQGVEDWSIFARELFGQGEKLESQVISPERGSARILLSQHGVLTGALFVSPRPVEVARGFLINHLGQPFNSNLLAGRPAVDQPDPGAAVCSCFNVGANTIRTAIESKGLRNVDEIGAALQAGTNCGSCRPELRSLLRSVLHESAQLNVAVE